MDEMKIAIVHDWLVTYAGADMVVDQLHQIFPTAPIYTLVYDKKKMPQRFQTYDIRTTYFQKIPFASKLYKSMFTLMPGAFERLDLTAYDLVISSCSSCSKGILTRSDAVHICYCNTPTRYLWDFYHTYWRNANFLKRLLIPRMTLKMRLWDRMAADRVDYFIANSSYIQKRIQKFYRRESQVIYPGVPIAETAVVDTPDDYYLIVGRLTYYKRVDIAVEACTRLHKKLIVIGSGDRLRQLKAMAGPTIEFKGYVDDAEKMHSFSRAKAMIFPGEEDFGIAPVEAQSAGCPILAFGKGGLTETVLDGQTGLFFHEQTADSLCQCIQQFEQSGVAYTRSAIQAHARQYSPERFRKEILAFCEEKTAQGKVSGT